MFIKQLSVFVANEPGRLTQIAELIGSAGVDIRAISVADTADYGVLRLIVDKPDAARDALTGAGLAATLTDVIAVGIDDKPGAFAAVLRTLSDAQIVVEYMYAFISRKDGQAYVILRVNDNAQALEVLGKAGVNLLEPRELYEM